MRDLHTSNGGFTRWINMYSTRSSALRAAITCAHANGCTVRAHRWVAPGVLEDRHE